MITGKLLFMGIIGVAALVLFIILLSKTEAMRLFCYCWSQRLPWRPFAFFSWEKKSYGTAWGR